MMKPLSISCIGIFLALCTPAFAQQQSVKIIKSAKENKADVFIGGKLFTSFLYPDSLEKPVLYPISAANGTEITRGFPLKPKAGDPTDHPHHIGLWFNYESVNGLDFWNNSYAIPAGKKNQYGWIRTDKITKTADGKTGILAYRANWTDQQKQILLTENTTFEFSGDSKTRIIDRTTTLTANMDVAFNDVKDGMLGLRLAHELQMPTTTDQKFTDDKGIVTVVKGGTDKIANGNYLSSEAKVGDAVWSTRGVWCKVYGKMGTDSVSVAIIDHPQNVNYPTFWHARGYGLFAANPLGEKVFTNGASSKNFKLNKGESVTFKYRVVIENGKTTLSPSEMNAMAGAFGKK